MDSGSGGSQWLVWRVGLDPLVGMAADWWGGQVFFQIWARRAFPYNDIQPGDTLYLLDKPTRRIVWEFRVANLIRSHVDSAVDAFGVLLEQFDLQPEDLNWENYPIPNDGWLLAYDFDVIGPLDIQINNQQELAGRGRRNGYAEFGAFADLVDPSTPLPAPGRQATLAASTRPSPTVETIPGQSTRHIRASVKQAVLLRDGHRCRNCGQTASQIRLS